MLSELICTGSNSIRTSGPIVAVTAHATAEYRVKALAAGCNEYVTKPIDFDKLGHLLNRLLRGEMERKRA